MQLFFTENIHNNTAILEAEEARHVVQVLRHKVGDVLQLTDGKGALFDAEIVDLGKKNCVLSLSLRQKLEQERPFKVHIAIAPTKNIDRLEWFLEKATEIGVDTVTPILCQRSERTVIKPERLQGILVSAMKQSLKTFVPILMPLTPVETFLKTAHEAQKFIAYCNDASTPLLQKAYEKGGDVVIMIGPEGDFSEKEVALAFAQGFKGVSLGQSRLRTETAGVVACHTIHLCQ